MMLSKAYVVDGDDPCRLESYRLHSQRCRDRRRCRIEAWTALVFDGRRHLVCHRFYFGFHRHLFYARHHRRLHYHGQ